ncbi:Myb-like DNA-binding domain containing protein [Tritrichomonas foetus]|uniref:Myb-like DNA-binding domain containing protein n=1 Tax=Tritrichomonas foetus TaxID=1144522 RepID=A0A1J4KXJ9_9EUKA|nr:Myb-like DNA-binding domain containing protein [Tritrichomonas foetus]|eukprot:OHT15979.1 Myb-like DNA-binding domain containing protein [Tritrichomonas foetus]
MKCVKSEANTKKINHKKRHTFSVEEDDKLRHLVAKYGECNWAFISSKMKKRDSRQCRDRWMNYLSPIVINGEWTDFEDNLLFEKVRTYGRKWKIISKEFPGRTEINVKNRWNFLNKKKILSEKNNHHSNLQSNEGDSPKDSNLTAPKFDQLIESFDLNSGYCDISTFDESFFEL